MYKEDLAWNNLQRLICHKTQQAKPTKLSWLVSWMAEFSRIVKSVIFLGISQERENIIHVDVLKHVSHIICFKVPL